MAGHIVLAAISRSEWARLASASPEPRTPVRGNSFSSWLNMLENPLTGDSPVLAALDSDWDKSHSDAVLVAIANAMEASR